MYISNKKRLTFYYLQQIYRPKYGKYITVYPFTLSIFTPNFRDLQIFEAVFEDSPSVEIVIRKLLNVRKISIRMLLWAYTAK